MIAPSFEAPRVIKFSAYPNSILNCKYCALCPGMYPILAQYSLTWGHEIHNFGRPTLTHHNNRVTLSDLPTGVD